MSTVNILRKDWNKSQKAMLNKAIEILENLNRD